MDVAGIHTYPYRIPLGIVLCLALNSPMHAMQPQEIPTPAQALWAHRLAIALLIEYQRTHTQAVHQTPSSSQAHALHKPNQAHDSYTPPNPPSKKRELPTPVFTVPMGRITEHENMLTLVHLDTPQEPSSPLKNARHDPWMNAAILDLPEQYLE